MYVHVCNMRVKFKEEDTYIHNPTYTIYPDIRVESHMAILNLAGERNDKQGLCTNTFKDWSEKLMSQNAGI